MNAEAKMHIYDVQAIIVQHANERNAFPSRAFVDVADWCRMYRDIGGVDPVSQHELGTRRIELAFRKNEQYVFSDAPDVDSGAEFVSVSLYPAHLKPGRLVLID